MNEQQVENLGHPLRDEIRLALADEIYGGEYTDERVKLARWHEGKYEQALVDFLNQHPDIEDKILNEKGDVEGTIIKLKNAILH